MDEKQFERLLQAIRDNKNSRGWDFFDMLILFFILMALWDIADKLGAK